MKRLTFGDEKDISDLKKQRARSIETTRVTITLKALVSIGIKKEQALIIITKLIDNK